MNIKGKIKEIFKTNQIKETFRKREFVVEYADNPNYPQLLKFELVNDNCSMIDGYQIGDEIEIDFDIRGREWINPKGEKIYFTSLSAYRLRKINGADNADNFEQPASGDIPPPDNDEDLPF
jgi:hypothetical protein